MAPIHGINAAAYVAFGGTTYSLFNARTWYFETDTDLIETSYLGLPWKTWLPQPMKWTGTIEGNFSDSNSVPFNALLFSLPSTATPVTIFLYPNRNDLTHFYSGNCWPKMSVNFSFKEVARYTFDFTGEGALSET